MLRIVLFCAGLVVAQAFDCYVCNHQPEDDDTQMCIDRLETCSEGVTSCSTVVYQSHNSVMHTRKFCTAPGTPAYQYLMFFPGSSLCQNIETSTAPPSQQPQPPAPIGGAPVNTFASPPAPPQSMSSNLLCVCTKSKCNQGTFRQVMENVLLQNMQFSDASFQDV